jgi:hypothetical protein
MATWADVRSLVRALPETDEKARREWRVKGKLLAWERPLRRADLAALGKNAPTGDVLGVWVPDLDTKEALLSARPRVYFTTPHFDGYAIVLVRLAAIRRAELRELLTEAWLWRAPRRATRAYVEGPGSRMNRPRATRAIGDRRSRRSPRGSA